MATKSPIATSRSDELAEDGSVPQPIDGKLEHEWQLAFPNLKWDQWEPVNDAGKVRPLTVDGTDLRRGRQQPTCLPPHSSARSGPLKTAPMLPSRTWCWICGQSLRLEETRCERTGIARFGIASRLQVQTATSTSTTRIRRKRSRSCRDSRCRRTIRTGPIPIRSWC